MLDDLGGRLGRVWREADEEATDRGTVVRDLLSGQYSNPVRVIAFNTAEGWSRDVSENVADEIARRCDDVPLSLADFIERHSSGRPTQLPLPLRGAA